jgi:hypothetical protein
MSGGWEGRIGSGFGGMRGGNGQGQRRAVLRTGCIVTLHPSQGTVGKPGSNCGTQTVPSQQSQAGVTTPANARQTDHYIPSSQGGSNTADNAVNSCATCNNAKSNTQPQGTQYELPRIKKPDQQ